MKTVCSKCSNYWQGTQGVNCCNLIMKTAFIARIRFSDINNECKKFEALQEGKK